MSKFSFIFLGNPTNKTVTRTAYTWEQLMANYLDQSEILNRSQVQFITLLFGGTQLCCAFCQLQYAARIYTFNSIIQSDIPSNGGDPLTNMGGDLTSIISLLALPW